jgi:hypothetical protein
MSCEFTIIKCIQDSPDTHKTKWFSKVWADFMELIDIEVAVSCDPFARNCDYATFTNDLNPDTNAQRHECALDFLKAFENNSIDFLIFDPPFSPIQDTRHYGELGVNLYASDGVLLTECLDEAARIVNPGGYVLKLGYNCNTFNPAFELVHLWIIQKNHRTHNNCTMVSLWINQQNTLDSF